MVKGGNIMAKLVKSYKGYKIKQTTTRDESDYAYWVIKPSWDTITPIWEADNLQECIDFVDGDKNDEEEV